ncbi:FbpB family small basic protein [Bacillus massilinigeriensis]|nr:FbpB family small basic protein [Bacillus mediterraneensis]
MKKKKSTMAELTQKYREELLRDKDQLAKIEIRLDEKLCRTGK